MSTKLTFRRNKLGNRAVQNLQTKTYIYKKLRDQVDNIIETNFIYQNVSPM